MHINAIPRLFPLLALVGALALGGWLVFWDPTPDAVDALPNANATDVKAATANLEALHLRAMARINSEDERDNDSSKHSNGITPEQAATRAQRFARARGDAVTHHHYIALQTRFGRPVYEVRIGATSVFVDADSGATGG